MEKTRAPLGRRGAVQAGNAQWQGARGEQQDAFAWHIPKGEGRAFAVLADGMGGLAGGAAAGQKAVQTFLAGMKEAVPDPARALEALADQADRELAAAGGCGATLAALLVQGGRAYWAAVGDSHIYLWRAGRLYQVNEDHNGALLRLHRSLKRPDAALPPPHKADEGLTAYLGQGDLCELDHSVRGLPLQRGDGLVLCTDGAYRALTAQEWAAELPREPQKAAERLIRLIRHKKIAGQDNCTVMILKWNEEDTP